jgi:glycosyltransferase involved in cell wall biosynthesis
VSARTRILMTADAVGGVWQYATELSRALAPRGYDVTLAVIGPRLSDTQRSMCVGDIVETGLALDWLAEDPAVVAAAGQALGLLATELGADLVQINHPALVVGARGAVPIVAMAHSCVGTWWSAVKQGPIDTDLAWQAELTGLGLAAADRVVCPSAAFAAQVQARYALPETPQTVHNGRTPPPAIQGAIHDFAFTAGRLWDQGKNLATLDRVAARLGIPIKAAGPLVGPHGETIALSHVHAMGQLDETTLARTLAARPVFVSTATYEPFGLAVLEAALTGCPLVLSDIPTFRELWDGAATFVAPDDDRGFARAIEELIGDERARLANGEHARSHAARYTPLAMAAGMARVYGSLPRADTLRIPRVAA